MNWWAWRELGLTCPPIRRWLCLRCVFAVIAVYIYSAMGELKKKRENRCQSGFLKAGSNDSRIVHFCAIKSKTYRVTLFLITMAGLCLKTNQNKS